MTHSTTFYNRKNDINNAAKHIYIIYSLYEVTITRDFTFHNVIWKCAESSKPNVEDEGFLEYYINHYTPPTPLTLEKQRSLLYQLNWTVR